MKKRTYKERIKRLNDIAIFKRVMRRIIEKEVTRPWLREYCDKNEIYFTLRDTKYSLAGKVIENAFKKGEDQLITDILDSAERHWSLRIEVEDKHKPFYYRMMLKDTKRARGLYNQIKEEI